MKITVIGDVSQTEVDHIIQQEKERFAARGKELAEVEIVELDSEELEIRSKAKTPIHRVRRITGYLSTAEKFNDAKQAELAERYCHG